MGGMKHFLTGIRSLAGADKKRIVNPIYLWIAALTFICVEICPFRIGMAVGESMLPTLKPYQMFLINKSIGKYVPNHNDVIVFMHDDEMLVKRVWAVEGENVWLLKSEEVKSYVPNMEVGKWVKLLKRYPQLGQLMKMKVPAGKVFVMGDNISASCDSRDFGPIDVKSIMGTARIPIQPTDPAYSVAYLGTDNKISPISY